nr:MAG TPA: hypothetical protein [Caudoviricetes sp.]
MDEHDIMVLLNNAVFPTEDIRDKVNELSENYDFMPCSDISVDLVKDSDDAIADAIKNWYNIYYVIGFVEIDDKFSKLIIRKVK